MSLCRSVAGRLVLLATLVVQARASLDQPVIEPLEVRLSYARAGDPSAQYNLGISYARGGEGVPKDAAKAATWFQRAAEQGFPEAEYNLGVCYLEGQGVTKDPKTAVRWFRAAAQQGVFPAQKVLMRCYMEGIGVDKSAAKALTWDFLARRSLELREELPAGLPPKPAMLRADGAAEYVTPDGRREALFPNGTVERSDAAGVRHLTRPDGATKIVTPNGGEQTVLANGAFEKKSDDGMRVMSDGKGAMQTTYPDGRRVTMVGGVTETILSDGSRTIEGPAKTTDGREIEARQSFDKNGKLIAQRVKEPERTVEVLADGTSIVESLAQEEGGGKVTLREQCDTKGKVVSRSLIRTDGTTRQGKEEWTIKRWIQMSPGIEVQVLERYGLGNTVLKHEPLIDTMRSRKPAPQMAAVPFPKWPGAGASAPAPPKPSAPASLPAVGIDQQLRELADTERLCRYFAGATEGDYDEARAVAARFTIALENAPQRLGSKQLETPAGVPPTLPPAPRLAELATDRSDKYPLGMHAREVINILPWKHAETEHFIVHYTQNSDARQVTRIIESAYYIVTQTLRMGGGDGRKSHVFVFPDQPTWTAFLRVKNMPATVAGFAYKDELLLTAIDEKEQYLKVICHEATHAVVGRFYPGRRWPLWMNEGFAEYMAAKSMATKLGRPIQRYLSSSADRPMNVAGVLTRAGYGASGNVLTDETGLRAFYPNSEKCVRTLSEKLPASSLPRFVNLVVAGNPIEVSLKEAYGAACPSIAAFKQLVDGLN